MSVETVGKIGAPSSYSPEIAKVICDEIAAGKSIRQICQGVPGMPVITTVYNWLYKQKDFVDQYALAREAQSEFYAQEMVDLADFCGLTQEEINKTKLQIDTRKWIAAKLKPKKYGDSTILRGDKENPIDIGLAALLDVAAQKRSALFSAPDSNLIEGESQRVIDVPMHESHEIPYSAPLEQSLAKAKPKTKSAKDFL